MPAGAIIGYPTTKTVYGRVKPANWEHTFLYRDPKDPWDNPPIDSTPAILKPNKSFVDVFGTLLFEPRNEFYEKALCITQDATEYEEVSCNHFYEKSIYKEMLNLVEVKLSTNQAFESLSKQRVRVIRHRLIRLLKKKNGRIVYDAEVLLYRTGKLYGKHMRIRFDGNKIIFAKVVGSVCQNDINLMVMGDKTLNDVGYVSIYPDVNTPINSRTYYRNDNFEHMYMPNDSEAQVRKFVNRNRRIMM